jgi:hypothetical protein
LKALTYERNGKQRIHLKIKEAQENGKRRRWKRM